MKLQSQQENGPLRQTRGGLRAPHCGPPRQRRPNSAWHALGERGLGLGSGRGRGPDTGSTGTQRSVAAGPDLTPVAGTRTGKPSGRDGFAPHDEVRRGDAELGGVGSSARRGRACGCAVAGRATPGDGGARVPSGTGSERPPWPAAGPREGTAGRGGVWAPAGRCAAVTVARGGHSAPTAWSRLTGTRGCRGPRRGRGHWEGAGGGDRGPWGAGMGITPGGGHRNRSTEGTAGRGPWTGHPRAQADSGAPRGAPRPRQAQERPSGGETAMPRAGVCTASPRGPHPAQLRPRGRGRWAVSPSATGSVRGLPPPQAR